MAVRHAMSVKSKFVLATYVVPSGAFIICAAMKAKPLGLALFVGSIIWYYYVKSTMKCPNCRERVWRGIPWSNLHWKLGIPLECEHCGFPFHT